MCLAPLRNPCEKGKDHRRTVIQRQIMGKLIVGSLQERTADTKYWPAAVFSNAGRKCDGVFLCNADVNELFRETFSQDFIKSKNFWGFRR